MAIIGQGYAAWAGIRLEDMGKAKLTVDPTRTHPVIYALDRPKRELTIVGMYASGYVFGDLQLFLPIDTFRSIYGTEKGVSWICARVDSVDNVATVAQRLRETVGDLADIRVPENAAVFTATTSRAVIRLAWTGALLAFLLMSLVVFFTLLMQVRERAREIGTLKAIGAGNGAVSAQFLTEAVALTLIGSSLGLVLFRLAGEAITGRLFAFGIGPFLPTHYKPLFESLLVGSRVTGPVLLTVVLVAIAAAVVGSAYGVRQLVRLSPLEAMRHD